MEPLEHAPPPPSKRRWLPLWVKVSGATLFLLLIAAAVVVLLIVLLLHLFLKLVEFIAPML